MFLVIEHNIVLPRRRDIELVPVDDKRIIFTLYPNVQLSEINPAHAVFFLVE